MKKLSKKILTVCLALLMTVITATSAFAAEIEPYADVYQPYYIHITASDGSNRALNSATGNADVNLIIYSGSDNQEWTLGRYNGTYKLYANATIASGQQMVLVKDWITSDVYLAGEQAVATISSIDFHTISSNTVRILFDGCSRYLEANTSYSDVTAAKYVDGLTRQIWTLTKV